MAPKSSDTVMILFTIFFREMPSNNLFDIMRFYTTTKTTTIFQMICTENS